MKPRIVIAGLAVLLEAARLAAFGRVVPSAGRDLGDAGAEVIRDEQTGEDDHAALIMPVGPGETFKVGIESSGDGRVAPAVHHSGFMQTPSDEQISPLFSLADDAGLGSKQRAGRGSARRRRYEYRKINC